MSIPKKRRAIKSSDYIAPETVTPKGEELYIDYLKLKEQYTLSDTQIMAAVVKGSQRITDVKLAEFIGVSRQTIYNWKQNQDFINLMNNVALLRLKGMFSDSVFKLEDLRESEDERIAFQATKYIMDSIFDVEKTLQTTQKEQEKDSIDQLMEQFKIDPERDRRTKTVSNAAPEEQEIIDPSEIM